MNTEQSPASRPQATHYRRMLESLLHNHATSDVVREDSQSLESVSFALMWALFLGRCRLFGAVLDGDMNRILPVDVAILATDRMSIVVRNAIVEAQQLPPRWDVAQTQLEFDTLVCDLLHVRMDSWAVLVAVSESERAETKLPKAQSQELNRSISSFVDTIKAFDVTLNHDADLLSIVVDTRLLDNWRTLLCEEYTQALPWWLDGTLERIADAPLERLDLSELGARGQVDRPPQSDFGKENKRRSAAGALAANDKLARPHYDEIHWKPRTSDLQSRAVLFLPATLKASGQTPIRLAFSGVQKQELVGKPVVLSKGRAIVQSRTLDSLPADPIVEAVFMYEEVGLPDVNLHLRVNNEEWIKTSESESDQ